jgi:hypothetical protein
MSVPAIAQQAEVHSRLASYILSRLPGDPGYASALENLDFAHLRFNQIRDILHCVDSCVLAMGRHNSLVVMEFLTALQHQVDQLDSFVRNEVESAVRSQRVTVSVEQRQEFVSAQGNVLRQMIQDSISDIQSIAGELHNELERIHSENAELSSAIIRIQRDFDSLAALSTNSEGTSAAMSRMSNHRNCRNIFREYSQHIEIATFPMHETEKLRALLCRPAGRTLRDVGRAIRFSRDSRRSQPGSTMEYQSFFAVID